MIGSPVFNLSYDFNIFDITQCKGDDMLPSIMKIKIPNTDLELDFFFEHNQTAIIQCASTKFYNARELLEKIDIPVDSTLNIITSVINFLNDGLLYTVIFEAEKAREEYSERLDFEGAHLDFFPNSLSSAGLYDTSSITCPQIINDWLIYFAFNNNSIPYKISVPILEKNNRIFMQKNGVVHHEILSYLSVIL